MKTWITHRVIPAAREIVIEERARRDVRNPTTLIIGPAAESNPYFSL